MGYFTAAIISIAAVLDIGFLTLSQGPRVTNYLVELDEMKYPLNASWTVSVQNGGYNTAKIETIDDEYVLMMYIAYSEDNDVILTDGSGKTYNLTIHYDKDNGITVRE